MEHDYYTVVPLDNPVEDRYTQCLLDLMPFPPLMYVVEPSEEVDMLIQVIMSMYEDGLTKHTQVLTAHGNGASNRTKTLDSSWHILKDYDANMTLLEMPCLA